MSKKTIKPRIPQELREDKPEEERKHRVLGKTWRKKAARLDKIFNFVATEKEHFVTFNLAPHTEGYNTELRRHSSRPVNIKPLRRRYYWANRKLDGYKKGNKDRVELRTEQKKGKGYWAQVLKLGSSSAKTLRRGEYTRSLDGFGTNLDVYTPKVRDAARKVVGNTVRKPLGMIECQSVPLLYHPDGRPDVIFEIKFDKGKGFTFDGMETDVVEVEIEVKEVGEDVSKKDIEALLDKSERILYSEFEGLLKPVYQSKPELLFKHLNKWRKKDRTGFEKAFDSLPGDRWESWSPS